MTSIAEHYERHLAPVYSWLMGGIDDALARGQQELPEVGLISGSGPRSRRLAVPTQV
jgi:hypothetical protein